MPSTGWANLILPLFRCFSKYFGVPAQFGQYWVSTYYVGLLVLGLAITSIWIVRERRVFALGVLWVLSLILALGDAAFLHRWLKQLIPDLGMFRYPIKWVVLSSFLLPLLGAWAVAVLEKEKLARRPALRFGLVFLALTLLLVSLAWHGHSHPLHPGLDLPVLANAVVRFGLLAAGVAALGVAAFTGREPVRRWAWIACLVFLGVDLKTHVPELNPTLTPQVFAPGLLKDPSHPMNLGEARGMILPKAEVDSQRLAEKDPIKDYLQSRKLLLSNCNLLDEHAKVDGLFSLYLRETDRITREMLYRSLDLPDSTAPLLDFLGVRTFIDVHSGGIAWKKRDTGMPWVFAGQAPRWAGQDETRRAIGNGEWNPREQVWIDANEVRGTTAAQAPDARVLDVTWGRHSVEFTTVSSAASFVTVAQAWYPAWRGYLDGREHRVFRANLAFQALEVPAGRHRVQLRYDDRAFKAGCVITLLAAIFLIWRFTDQTPR